MKSIRNILSNNGILAVIAILLTIAATLVFIGIGLEAQDRIAGISIGSGESITSFVMSGVMGNIPSVAGTLQCFAIALAYGLTPLVVVSMFAARLLTKTPSSAFDVLA